jgi:hypothetical protein
VLDCCEENGMISCKTPASAVGSIAKAVPFFGAFLAPLAEQVPIVGGGGKEIISGQVPQQISFAQNLNAACKVIGGDAFYADINAPNPWFKPAPVAAPVVPAQQQVAPPVGPTFSAKRGKRRY